MRQRADRWNKIGSPKSATGQREVPLAPMVVNTLKEWQPACPKGEAKLIFPNGKGAVDSLPNMHRRGLGALQVACAIATDLRRRRDRIRYVGVRHEEAAAFTSRPPG